MPPVRGRELKHQGNDGSFDVHYMPPVRGRELKLIAQEIEELMESDAPCAGARIETSRK